MLKVDNIKVCYGAIHALRGVSIDVPAGEIVSIVGSNGAGKSTLMRAISGLVPIASGRILFEGRDITQVPSHKRVGLGIAQVPEGRLVFPDQTVHANLTLGTWSRVMSRNEVGAEIGRMFEIFPRLKEREEQMAGTLSGGEQQMLAIARALMSRPRLLMLDEPSLGLAPMIARDIFHVVSDICRKGVTVVLVEQMANRAMAISQETYVLENGRITLSGNSGRLLSDPKVREAYLGRQGKEFG